MPSISKIMDGVVDRIYHPTPGLMTGLGGYDAITSGIHKKQLSIIAGRPSMGKSALALDITLNLVHNEFPTAFFTMEDSADMVVRRLLSKQAKVSMVDIRDNRLTGDQRDKINAAASAIRPLPLMIDDTSALSGPLLWQRLAILKEKMDVQAVFIDYMQLFQVGDLNRQEGLESLSVLLKDAAKHFDVAMVVMSQLNREPDKRENHEPRMSDLRGSGGIEQSADIVSLLYRPSYYTMQEIDIDAEDDGEAYVIIGKHKNGPTGKVKCGYVADWMSFMDAPKGAPTLGDNEVW